HIAYTFTLTNTGSVTVDEIQVTDELQGLGTISFVPGESDNAQEGVLEPGQTAVYTASYALAQGDLDAGFVRNTATASGDDPFGNEVSDESGSGNEYQPEEGEPGYDPDCLECAVT